MKSPLSTQPGRDRRALPVAADRGRPVLTLPGHTGHRELDISLFTCVVLSAVYIAYELLAEPSGSHPFGHWLGVLGTLLMLSTETLYSARKRLGWLAWAGPLRWWLALHIFTGIVGPFLVLMHTGLEFRGLAGITMALTILVVASGFVGRYFYTAIPHTLVGAEASRAELRAESARLRAFLERFASHKSARVQHMVVAYGQRAPDPSRSDLLTVFGRAFYQWRFRRRLHREVRRLEKTEQQKLTELERVLTRKRELDRQIDTLQTARRVMSLWHVLHVPLGLTLFCSVAIHVGATIYFRTGLF